MRLYCWVTGRGRSISSRLMSEPNPRDYTTGELTSAANLFREASELLSPTADELVRIADGFDVELADDALHLTRTARHLTASALYLKVGELTIRRLTRDIGRGYQALRNRLLVLIMFMSGVTIVLELASLLPGHLPHVLGEASRGPAAYLLGFATATWLADRATRPPPGP